MANKQLLPEEIIRRKRDGQLLTNDQIQDFIDGVVSGSVTDGQIAAFSMAVFFQHMDVRECSKMTLAMRDTGNVLRWDRSRFNGPIVDKHSSGGVGDCVSLMLAPMLASCGAYVPMISGRGLGHSGGTLDKLSSIPGYLFQSDIDHFQKVVETVGCAIVGQSASLAPADGRIYSVRDVTATVESVPLITASILSKKLAAGIDALVMDVKTGNGAFADTTKMAIELADNIVQVAGLAGVPTVSLVTDMNQPLASSAGNALEVVEAVRYLKNEKCDPRLDEVILALGSELLVLCGLETERVDAIKLLKNTIADGMAAERFSKMIAFLGGPHDFIEKPQKYLQDAPIKLSVKSEHMGTVSDIDTRLLGLIVVELGGGRLRPQDEIDTSVGLSHLARIGDKVAPNTQLALIHAKTSQEAEEAHQKVLESFRIGEKIYKEVKLIRDIRKAA